ncbi:MAG: PTS IIA-like nitrogen regulatory protein PtsN [Alphaproteobacteria bacterium]
MEIEQILSSEGVVDPLRASSKRQALQELSERAAVLTGISGRELLETILGRERLGTTGVGHGVAIPHGRIDKLDRLHGLFARLPEPIDFDSIDDQPVDLIFMLLAPESAGADHLKALAKVSRLLRDKSICDKLRGSDGADALYALLTDSQADAA